jgi:hypothetical protein
MDEVDISSSLHVVMKNMSNATQSKIQRFQRPVETPLLYGLFSMSASHLGKTPLDIAKLRDAVRKRLPELLDTVCTLLYPSTI